MLLSRLPCRRIDQLVRCCDLRMYLLEAAAASSAVPPPLSVVMVSFEHPFLCPALLLDCGCACGGFSCCFSVFVNMVCVIGAGAPCRVSFQKV